MIYRYRVYGLTLQSELPCPELPEGVRDEHCDIAVRFLPTVEPAESSREVHVADIAGVARYRVERAREISIQPASGARAEDIRQYLYGIALTAVLYQRGESPIHAAAVAMGGRAHIVCGESGAGKSTLMMQLRRQGVTVLCDDVGVIRTGPDDVVRFYHGVPRLKLWQDALAHFGIDYGPLQRDLARFDKFHLPLEGAGHDALPLASIFRFVSTDDAAVPEIVALSSKQVLEVLMRNTYRPRLLKRLGDPGTHAARCIAAARQAAGLEFRRPWNLARLEACAEMFVTQLATMTAQENSQ